MTKYLLGITTIILAVLIWVAAVHKGKLSSLDSSLQPEIGPHANSDAQYPVFDKNIPTESYPKPTLQFPQASATACEPSLAADDPVEYTEEEWKLIRESAIQRLQKSDDVEHLLLTAHLLAEENKTDVIKTLLQALNIEPNNPLILWDLLEACSDEENAKMCGDLKIEKLVGQRNLGNGMLWGSLASKALNRNDFNEASIFLRKATVAPLFSSMTGERLQVSILPIASDSSW